MSNQDTVYENWKTRFPLCFERTGCCMTFGIDHGSGWNGIIERLLQKIEAHLAVAITAKYTAGFRDPDPDYPDYGFQIDQIKEKFGTLRVYVSGADDQIFQWIDKAVQESTHTCETCGAGDALKYCHTGGYWLYTRCPQCADPAVMEPYNTEKHNI